MALPAPGPHTPAMPPRSLTAPAAALLTLLSAPAFAVMCLKPGSFGPDVPNCSPYQEAAAAAKRALSPADAAIGDNLLALAGEAAAERYNERTALEVAGTPTQAQAAAAKAAKPRAARPADAPAKPQDYEAIAGTVVKGAGGSFQGLDAEAPRPAAPTAARTAAAAPPAPATTLDTGAVATGRSQAMTPNQRVTIGAAVADPGRSLFDRGSTSLPEDTTPAPPPAATVQQCTILHPCAHAN